MDLLSKLLLIALLLLILLSSLSSAAAQFLTELPVASEPIHSRRNVEFVSVESTSTFVIPTFVYIGGAVSPFAPDGTVDLVQTEHLAAFVMALREINNKTDGLYDDILPNTKLDYAMFQAISRYDEALGLEFLSRINVRRKIVSSVCALPSDASLFLNKVLTEIQLPQMITEATDYALSDREQYPYLSKAIALEPYEGTVIQQVLGQYFQVQRIVIFSTAAMKDITLMQNLVDSSVYSFEVLADIVVRDLSTSQNMDFQSEIQQALVTRAKYFVIFMSPKQTAALIEQGYRAGLFGSSTVIIASSRSSTNLTSFFSDSFDIVSTLKGFFTIKYVPSDSLRRTPQGRSFLNRWKQQKSTAGVWVPSTNGNVNDSSSGSWVCDNSMDDAGHSYLYRHALYSDRCAGIDFSRYAGSEDREGEALELQPTTALTYDATIFMAKAIDFAIKNELDCRIAEQLQSIIVHNISLDGVSGLLDVSEGLPLYDYYDQGNREVGNHYQVLNFNPIAYENDIAIGDVNRGFVWIGQYDGNINKYRSCADMIANNSISNSSNQYVNTNQFQSKCYFAVFGEAIDGDYSIPPSDHPAAIVHTLGFLSKALSAMIGMLLFFIIFIVSVLFYFRRYDRSVLSSNPVLLCVLLFGGLLAIARLAVGTANKTTEVCSWELSLGHLSIGITVFFLFIKAYRVYKLTRTNSQLKYMSSKLNGTPIFASFASVSNSFWNKMLGIMLTLDFIYIIVAVFIGQPEPTIHIAHDEDVDIIEYYCSLREPFFHGFLLMVEFVMMVITITVAYETRAIKEQTREAGPVFYASLFVIVMTLITSPLIKLVNISPIYKELARGICIACASLVTISWIFIPKFMRTAEPVRRRNSNSQQLFGTPSQKSNNSSDKRELQQRIDEKPTDGIFSYTIQQELLLGESSAQQLQICLEQLTQWKLVFLQLHGVGDWSSNGQATQRLDENGRVIPSNSGVSEGSEHGSVLLVSDRLAATNVVVASAVAAAAVAAGADKTKVLQLTSSFALQTLAALDTKGEGKNVFSAQNSSVGSFAGSGSNSPVKGSARIFAADIDNTFQSALNQWKQHSARSLPISAASTPLSPAIATNDNVGERMFLSLGGIGASEDDDVDLSAVGPSSSKSKDGSSKVPIARLEMEMEFGKNLY